MHWHQLTQSYLRTGVTTETGELDDGNYCSFSFHKHTMRKLWKSNYV